MAEFGSISRGDGVLHAVSATVDPLYGNVAACDSSLPIAWIEPYDEHYGWQVCKRPACLREQTRARVALGLIEAPDV